MSYALPGNQTHDFGIANTMQLLKLQEHYVDLHMLKNKLWCTWDPQTGSSFREIPAPWLSWEVPLEKSANRSLSTSSLPQISTADTRMENRVPAFSFLSSMSLKSQDIAQGATPKLCVELSLPIMV